MHLMNDTGAGFTIEQLVNSLAVPAFFVGPGGMVNVANAAAVTFLFGGQSNPKIHQDVRSWLPVPRGQDFFDQFSQNPDTKSAISVSTVVKGSSGSAEYRVSRIDTKGGTCLGYFFQCPPSGVALIDRQWQNQVPAADAIQSGTTDDVTLTESEWRWKTAVLSANQAVWDHDFEHDRHFVSQTWLDLRGLTEHDPIPKSNETWLATIHPQDVDHLKEELRRLESCETDIINYKFRQRHTAGHWVWFLSSGRVARRDSEGLPARIIGTDTDITDIKTVELESHRLTKRLDTAMEAAGMGRWEFDVGANNAYWDDRMLELFGITDGINIRASTAWSDYIHPDDREAMEAIAQEGLDLGKDIACDYRHLRPDGTVRHIRTRGKYVEDAEYGPRYYGVNFDVTRDYERAQELEAARARLEHESRHDALTGLANRRYLDDVFTEITKGKDASSLRPTVMHFDIDHFKQINDTLGHDAGDATLKHAAEVLLKNVPKDALVSRVGGDEFVTLFFDSPDPETLVETAKNIIQDMSQPFHYGSQQCNIGTSIGIATSEDTDEIDSGIFIHADLALYAAKKAGRGRYRFFTAALKQEARRRKNSFDALLAGFDQGEITCHYQPQFNAETLELIGLEALVRWESKDFGLIMPEEFLTTAEDMGLVAQFDELVLRKALHDLGKWQDQGFDVPRISVNVSSHRLNDPTLIERLKPLSLPKGKISFELLESAFLDSKNEVIERNLRQIDQMGIEIEIDDFGSGHASIVSLLQVAPKRLKIDRFLIEPIVRSTRQRDLVKTIVEIGKMLDVRVVAEGVETWEHVAVLQEIGCCFLQGYGLARPMDADAISDLLTQLHSNHWRLA